MNSDIFLLKTSIKITVSYLRTFFFKLGIGENLDDFFCQENMFLFIRLILRLNKLKHFIFKIFFEKKLEDYLYKGRGGRRYC